jgi:uncharacterized phiE125 gp8 family phage protein
VGLKLVTPPEVEPITLEEAKSHLRIDTDAEDVYVSALITAARERVELFLRRALATQTFEYTLDGFPSGVIDIPRPPLQSAGDIKYLDTGGNERTLPPELYVEDRRNKLHSGPESSGPGRSRLPIKMRCTKPLRGSP